MSVLQEGTRRGREARQEAVVVGQVGEGGSWFETVVAEEKEAGVFRSGVTYLHPYIDCRPSCSHEKSHRS